MGACGARSGVRRMRVLLSVAMPKVDDVAPWRLQAPHGTVLAALFLVGCAVAQAQAGPGTPSIVDTLAKWTPLLARGFVFNLAISFVAMAIGTIAGFFLGAAQISLFAPVRGGAWFTMNFFRNAPWLVL